MDKSLDRKLARIHADPTCREFILADAKDGDMALGIGSPGRSPEAHPGELRFRTLEEYREFTAAVDVPVLANITEFGMTPLYTVDELKGTGVALVLYPLSAFRAMSQAALAVYAELRRSGTQQAILDRMQTRAELYEVLGYHEYERKLDELYAK